MNYCLDNKIIKIMYKYNRWFFSALIFLFTGVMNKNMYSQNLSGLAESLTLHASFDHGLDADYSTGDGTIYSFSTIAERNEGGTVGFPNNSIRIAKGAGKYGNALLFTNDASFRPFFRDEGNIGYNDENWSGTLSVWLRLTPEFDLGPGYCDPIQIIGDDMSQGFIFLEFDKDPQPQLKNPPPKYFRYSLQPIRDLWNPENIYWGDIPFEDRPMVQVAHAPFSRAKWTHVVFTFVNVNSDENPKTGSLYIDGRHQGTFDDWDLTLGWNPEEVLLVLGHEYVGHLDELSFFNRALSKDEIQLLFSLENGIKDLY
jgi:hypothetical protein